MFTHLSIVECVLTHGKLSLIVNRLQVTSFNRVATDRLQGSIHEIRKQNSTWAAFEETMKTTNIIEDSSKEMRRGFEDWLQTPDKGLKVLEVFLDFESQFVRLSSHRTRCLCFYAS